MNKKIEYYLENLSLPDFEPSSRMRDLRRNLVCDMAKQQKTTAKYKRILLVFAIAVFAGLSSIVATAQFEFREYVFKEKQDTNTFIYTKAPAEYVVIGEDGKEVRYTASSMTGIKLKDPNSPNAIEEGKKILMETDVLRSKNLRELVGIRDIQYAGTSYRVYRYKYVLADGKEIYSNEKPPGEFLPYEMSKLDFAELARLRKAEAGERLPSTEEEVKGRTFIFKRYRQKLQDGSEVIQSIGIPAKSRMPDVAASNSGFVLHPNVPNPFNPQTTIRYDIPEASAVQIVVYNIIGQKVRTLLDQQIEAGSHQVVWDGQDDFGRRVASGTYIVAMKGADFYQTMKVTFAK